MQALNYAKPKQTKATKPNHTTIASLGEVT